MSLTVKPCESWCRSVAHGARGYCTRACRDRAERAGTAEDHPDRVLFVGGMRVPEWAPIYDGAVLAGGGKATDDAP